MDNLVFIICNERSGGGLLHDSLSKVAQTDVIGFKEIFDYDYAPKQQQLKDILLKVLGRESFNLERSISSSPNNKIMVSQDFLTDYLKEISRSLNPNQTGLCKILFRQLPYYYDIWNTIIDSRCNIIRIKRFNYFEMYVSQFLLLNNEIPFIININDILKYFIYLDMVNQFLDIKLSKRNKQILEINYEDLFSWRTIIKEVTDFLNIFPINPILPVYQKNTYIHSNFVINYKEIRQYFQNTKWKIFFMA